MTALSYPIIQDNYLKKWKNITQYFYSLFYIKESYCEHNIRSMPYYNLATALNDEIIIGLMQDHVTNCLNKILKENNLPQKGTLEEAILACSESSVLDDDTCYACLSLSHKGNKGRYDAIAYLTKRFGCGIKYEHGRMVV